MSSHPIDVFYFLPSQDFHEPVFKKFRSSNPSTEANTASVSPVFRHDTSVTTSRPFVVGSANSSGTPPQKDSLSDGFQFSEYQLSSLTSEEKDLDAIDNTPLVVPSFGSSASLMKKIPDNGSLPSNTNISAESESIEVIDLFDEDNLSQNPQKSIQQSQPKTLSSQRSTSTPPSSVSITTEEAKPSSHSSSSSLTRPHNSFTASLRQRNPSHQITQPHDPNINTIRPRTSENEITSPVIQKPIPQPASLFKTPSPQEQKLSKHNSSTSGASHDDL